MKNIVRHIFSALLCGTLLSGCMKDDTQTPAAVQRDILQLSVPGQTTVSVYSTEDENECRLFNYWMLVFRSGALVHKQTEASVAPTANGTTSPSIVFDNFLPTQGDVIYVAANAPAGLAANLNGFSVGSPESSLSSQLISANPVFSQKTQPATGQPMFGKTEWTDAGQNVCLMVRALAKITVKVEPALLSSGGRWADKTLKWEIVGAPQQTSIETTYNPATKCYEIPDPTSYYLGWDASKSTPNDLNTPLYSASYPNATVASGNQTVSKNNFSKGRTALMLYVSDNASGRIEYYRLDFSRQTRTTSLEYFAENEFLDIDCNTHYYFLITDVKSGGYATFDEAWSNPGSNIEYTINANNISFFSQNVVSNGQYAVCMDRDTVMVRSSDTNACFMFQIAASYYISDETKARVSLVSANKTTVVPVSKMALVVKDSSSPSRWFGTNNEYETSLLNACQTARVFCDFGAAFSDNDVFFLKISAGNIETTVPVAFFSILNIEGGNTVNIPYSGGSHACSVASYSIIDGTIAPEPWITEFSVDGGTTWSATAPAWLTGIPTSGSGGKTAQNFTASVAAQSQQIFDAYNLALKSASPVSNYDLSTGNSSGGLPKNTANCYLVNAPGTYRLPLIYGNGIKAGSPNASAYTSKASGTNILSPFLDHMGSGISTPYIYYRYTPSDCCLVWQDVNGLVTNVHLSSDGHYLEFEVPQATICQGNAVVAVRDASNRIMWSWHIWVTDYRLGTGLQTTTNYQGKTYRFLPYNIGWCDEISLGYPARSVQVRFTQTSKGAQQIVTINQTEGSRTTISSGNNPYFQWGRKDPILPGLIGGLDGVNKSFFSDSGYAFSTSNLGTSIDKYIQNPHLFNTNYYMDNKYYNLWSANNTVTSFNDNVVVKTVYDPSPVGFCMPPSNAWTGFTTTGGNTDSASRIRGTWDSTVSPAGYNFDITGGTAYFPALGFRYDSSGELTYVGRHGYYWSAVPNITDYGYFLYFNVEGYVYPLNNYSKRGLGFPVRPVHE